MMREIKVILYAAGGGMQFSMGISDPSGMGFLFFLCGVLLIGLSILNLIRLKERIRKEQ